MENSKITIAPMSLPFIDSVSLLLTEAFHSKFSFLSKKGSGQLAKGFETLLTDFHESKTSIRVVAIHDGVVVGTLALQWGAADAVKDKAWPSRSTLAKLYEDLGKWTTWRLLAGLAALSHTPSIGECYITDIAVDSRCRGKGVGKLLLNWAKQYASNCTDIHKISLHVADSNTGARKLYERFRFRPHIEGSNWFRSLLFLNKRWTYMTNELRGN